MAEPSWAVAELGGAELGDARRTARLVALAAALGERPQASLPEACVDRASLKAAYRFFSNDAVEAERVLGAHITQTQARLAAERVVLAVQDTTELDFTHHPATTGLGPLQGPRQGLLVHSTLAFTPERVPLGLLAQQVWTRDPDAAGRQSRRARPIDEKESAKWLHSVAAVAAAQACCPTTHFISVGDREADVYDLFLVERPAGVDLLVRAAWNRRVEDAAVYLRAAAAAAPVLATVELALPRRGQQPARTATLTIRAAPVTLRPPRHRASEHLPAVALWLVWAVERTPPPGCAALDWLLLTTLAVADAAGALTCVAYYAARFGIEVWHKVLKSGCRIEARQLADGAHLRRALALYAVIAWRLLHATLLARSVPEAPCTLVLTTDEWQALACAIHQVPTPPTTPPSLRQAVRWIAQLGGFLGRPADGEPGVTVLWRGLQQLAALTTMYAIMKPPRPPTDVGKD